MIRNQIQILFICVTYKSGGLVKLGQKTKGNGY